MMEVRTIDESDHNSKFEVPSLRTSLRRSKRVLANKKASTVGWEDIEIGSRVGVLWDGDNCYYSGTIKKQK